MIDEIALSEYNRTYLNEWGNEGWQAVHIEDYTEKGTLYDSGERKIIGDVKKRRITFMCEIDQSGEKDV